MEEEENGELFEGVGEGSVGVRGRADVLRDFLFLFFVFLLHVMFLPSNVVMISLMMPCVAFQEMKIIYEKV